MNNTLHLHALTPAHSPAHPHTHSPAHTHTHSPAHTVTATDFIQKLATAEKDHSNKLSQVVKEFREKTKEKRWQDS